MKCFKLKNSGVIKLVPINKEDTLNDLYKQGYRCVNENGAPVIIEMDTPKKINFISDPEVRDALTKINSTEKIVVNKK